MSIKTLIFTEIQPFLVLSFWASLYSVLVSVEAENSKVNIAAANKRTLLNWFYLLNDKNINNTENKHN